MALYLTKPLAVFDPHEKRGLTIPSVSLIETEHLEPFIALTYVRWCEREWSAFQLMTC